MLKFRSISYFSNQISNSDIYLYLIFTTRLVSLPGGRSVRPRGHRQPSIINMVAHINSDKIVAGTSPTIKISQFTQVSSATS